MVIVYSVVAIRHKVVKLRNFWKPIIGIHMQTSY